MKDKIYSVVDIGGTKILVLLIDAGRTVLFRERYATPRGVSPEELIDITATAIHDALCKVGRKPTHLAGLGVCIAALINYKEGQIYQSPNLKWYRPVPFRAMLQQRFACPVYMENDANAAVVGEVNYGSARGHRDVIYITISTGIGGGLFLNGKLYRGGSGFAGEIGHMKPFGQGRRCGCGGYDCLEAWAAGTALVKSASQLWDEKEVAGGMISAAWVFDQAEAGNSLALALVEQATVAVGIGLANLVTIFNPTCLVIGGGVAANRPGFLEQIREQIKNYAIFPCIEATRIEIKPAALEPEAGIWGMYALMQNDRGA